MQNGDPSTWYLEDKGLDLLREMAFALIEDNDFVVELVLDEEKVKFSAGSLVGEATLEGPDPQLNIWLCHIDEEQIFPYADEAMEWILSNV